MARACGLLSLYPAIYDFASAPTSDVALIVSPAIVHLHGQGHGVVLLNTEEETKAHSAKIAPVLRQSMDRPLVVIGYSGETDDVLRIVRDYYPGGEYLYWLSHDDDPHPAVRNVAERHAYFKCVSGVDAGRFLIELAQKLRCWPPSICTNPIGHLLAELKPVSDYPTVPEKEVDILLAVRSRLAELEKSELEKERATRQIEKSLFEGRFDEAVKAFDSVPAGRVTDDQRNLATAALMLAGENHYNEARKAADPAAAERLFKLAETKVEAALRIQPDDQAALTNWGTALAGRAGRVSDTATAEELFKQAEAKYDAALRIKPDDHEVLNNWGATLADRARRASDAVAAEELFKQAEVKCEAALRIKPDKHEALYNWGTALAGRAQRASDAAAAEELFKQAEVKYEAALRIKPDDDEVLNNWGNALAGRARRASDAAAAEELFKQAEAKYEAALRVKSDDHEALYNWGTALAGRARRASDAAAAEELFKQAEAKYEAALRIKPDDDEALKNWGNALADRARRASDAAAAEELFKQAEAKYEAALRIKTDDHAMLYAVGSMSLERAKRRSGQGRGDLLRAAVTKLKMAEEIGNIDTYNLACAYGLLGGAGDCRTALEAVEKAGMLPTIDHLRSDADLKLVRDEPWFSELIDRLRKSSM